MSVPDKAPSAPIVQPVLPTRSVYVVPRGRIARFVSGCWGELTHRALRDSTVVAVTVRLGAGVDLICDPDWIVPPIDWTAAPIDGPCGGGPVH